MNMEIAADEQRKPRISIAGLLPIFLIMRRDILLWKFQRSMARARRKPPRKRAMVLLKKSEAVSLALSNPIIGNSNKGRSDVTARGRASVIQKTAIWTATAAMNPAFGFCPPRFRRAISKNRTIPETNPAFCIFVLLRVSMASRRSKMFHKYLPHYGLLDFFNQSNIQKKWDKDEKNIYTQSRRERRGLKKIIAHRVAENAKDF
jgi:hypothetical protein